MTTTEGADRPRDTTGDDDDQPTRKVPALYGTEEEKLDRERFFLPRVRKYQKRWRTKHDRAVLDALAAGRGYNEPQARAIADEKWGAEMPTDEEARELVIEDMRKRIESGAGGRLDEILANELAARSED